MSSSARKSPMMVYENQKVAANAWHVTAPYLSDAEPGRDQLITVPQDFGLRLEEIQ